MHVSSPAVVARFLGRFGKLLLTIVTLIAVAQPFTRLRADTRAGAPLASFVAASGINGIDVARWLPGGGVIYVTGNKTYRLLADGSADTGYTSHTFNQRVKSILVRADGSVLVAGLYTVVDGDFSSNRHYLVHLAADGTLDQSFPSFAGTGILALAAGADGKFYVANANGSGLLRYNADGTRDTAFFSPSIGSGAIGGKVWAVKELADGHVLVAHQTTTDTTFGIPNGYYIQRLTSTGAVDPAFTGPTLLGPATALDVLPDGRIVIAGPFASVDGDTAHASIALLHADGTLDTTFSVNTPRFLGDSDSVDVTAPSLRVQGGKILLGGNFTAVSGQTVGHLVRLNFDGTLDNTFAFGADLKLNARVSTIDLTPSGDIFVAGNFTSYTGSSNSGTIWRSLLLAGSASSPPPDTLAAPVLGETTGITKTALTLHWTASVGATGYRAELSTGADFVSDVLTQTLGAGATSATFTGLAAGTTYHIRVTALGAGDATAAGSPGTATTASGTPPPAPPRAKQTIDFPQPARATYGDAPIELTATASSGLDVTFTLVSGPAELSENQLTLAGAGKVVVRANQAGDTAFLAAPAVTRTIIVDKAKLLVRADDAQRLVDQPNPPFTLHYSGFVGDDTLADLVAARLPKPATNAKKTSPGGEYPITLSGGSDANYVFTLAPDSGRLFVQGFGGAFEALLLDPSQTDGEDAVPLGKLEISVSANSLGYTGAITLSDAAKTIAISGRLTPAGEAAGAAWSPAGVAAETLRLDFTVAGDSLAATLSRPGRETLDTQQTGARLLARPETLEGAGAYTLALRAGGPFLDGGDAREWPPGAGHAAASLSARTGDLRLKGKLADGTALTGTLRVGVDDRYRVFIKPYGARPGSFLSGSLALAPHANAGRFPKRFQITDGLLLWQKAALPGDAKTPDAACRAGFGPLDLLVSLDPWLPPVAARAAKKNVPAVEAVTLVQRLGLADTNDVGAAFDLAYAGEPDFGARAASLPSGLLLAADGKIAIDTPVEARANPAKWTLKLDPATGSFSGSFELLDAVPAPTSQNPAKTKPLKRPVSFFGTLIQGAEEDSTIGIGHLLLAPAGSEKNPEQTSIEIRFVIPDA